MISDSQYFKYCCTDSCVTAEILPKLLARLGPQALSHYRFNLNLLPPVRYAMARGLLYDQAKAKQLIQEYTHQQYELQHRVNQDAGRALPGDSSALACQLAGWGAFKKKRALVTDLASLIAHAKPKCAPVLRRVRELVQCGDDEALGRSKESIWGEISVLCEQHLNVDSAKQMEDYLYDVLALPKQFKKERGKLTDRTTQDKFALLKLYTLSKKEETRQVLLKLLKLRSVLSTLEMLAWQPDPDGRMRCSLNIVGTETGRFACYTSDTGSGGNLQTVPKKLRRLYLADPGCWLYQCDLSGADGWTIAAICKSLGDSTMWDDYLAGLKPAKVLVLLAKHGPEINNWPRSKIKEASKEISSDDWHYAAYKGIAWGSCYLMQPAGMSRKILLDAYKVEGEVVYVSPDSCRELQQWVFVRYPGIKRWHAQAGQQLGLFAGAKQQARLTAASGHTRIFFGDPEDHKTLGEWLADLPQEHTTYATCMALAAAWQDPENQREGFPPLWAEPLHTVHDSLILQGPQERAAWTKAKLRQWFDNPMTIAGQRVTIPYAGEYGRSWGALSEGEL